MSPTLEILHEAIQFGKPDITYQKKLNNLISFQDKVQAQFGLDFLNEFTNAWDDLHMVELDRAFEQGFLAAFQLWMEVSSLEIR